MVTFQRKALLSNEARAGLLILLAVIAVVAGIAFLEEYSFRKEEYEITALFDTVIGLDKNDPVIVSGLKVGKVGAMRLGKDKVEVVLRIDSRYHFPRDSKAILKNLTLLGEKAIEIVRGQSEEELPEGAVIAGTLEADIFELTEAAAPIGEDLAVLIKRFRSTFNDEAQANLQASLRNIETISGAVAQNVDENVATLRRAIQDLSVAAQNLQKLSNPKNKNLDDILANLKATSANLKTASQELQSSSASLNRILNKMEHGKGALGRLLTDDTVYHNLERASAHLDSLILDVTKHPRKYLKVTVF
ncbi:MAG: MCE family protein [Calditrichaeota bacterium]|nr:MAG: MCE family protein [Calditrichota bacterium]